MQPDQTLAACIKKREFPFPYCLDDLDSSDERVVVIGVTSRPETIDSGLRRAGRFEREVCLNVPNETARIDILRKLTRNMRLRD